MTKLKPGDLLVFKAGDNWVGKAIAWLTESDVSHAAMMLEDGKMVEMGASGIHAGSVEALDGDGAMLLRLSPERDAAPLMSAAQKYIDSETRYDFPALVILAGLIIYRRIRPTPKLVAITDIVLRAACEALDGLIQSVILKNTDKAMVCSQLVYQIYDDCGKEYRIQIREGLFQDAREADDLVCLADLAMEAKAATEPGLIFQAENTSHDTEDLARELCAALEEQNSNMDFAAANFGELPSWTKRFLEKLEDFLEKSSCELPLNALFISPADLAYRATNLTVVDRLDIKRLNSDSPAAFSRMG